MELDGLAKLLYGMTKAEAHAKGSVSAATNPQCSPRSWDRKSTKFLGCVIPDQGEDDEQV
jgi:hypothetical protein